jgi:hypothetical protein
MCFKGRQKGVFKLDIAKRNAEPGVQIFLQIPYFLNDSVQYS